MISRISGTPNNMGNTSSFKKYITAFAGLMAVGALFTTTQADAQRVVFRSNGGRWSHSYHSGWHRYWGGPSVGFYYAPSPVYMVNGYSAPRYYTGSDFWYSNPSFGLNLNLGGGGGRYYRGHAYSRPYRTWHGAHHWR